MDSERLTALEGFPVLPGVAAYLVMGTACLKEEQRSTRWLIPGEKRNPTRRFQAVGGK